MSTIFVIHHPTSVVSFEKLVQVYTSTYAMRRVDSSHVASAFECQPCSIQIFEPTSATRTAGINGVSVLPLEKASWLNAWIGEDHIENWCDPMDVKPFFDPELEKFDACRFLFEKGIRFVFVELRMVSWETSDEYQIKKAKLIVNTLTSHKDDRVVFFGNTLKKREKTPLGKIFYDTFQNRSTTTAIHNSWFLYIKTVISPELLSLAEDDVEASIRYYIAINIWCTARDIKFGKDFFIVNDNTHIDY